MQILCLEFQGHNYRTKRIERAVENLKCLIIKNPVFLELNIQTITLQTKIIGVKINSTHLFQRRQLCF